MSRIAEAGAPDLFGIVRQSPSISPAISPAEPYKPHGVGFKGEREGPSEAAAKIVKLTVTGRRREVLTFLQDRLRNRLPALTADEIADRLNRSPFGVRPRVSELHALGLIEPDNERGKNPSGMTAHKWRAVPADRLPTNQDQTP